MRTRRLRSCLFTSRLGKLEHRRRAPTSSGQRLNCSSVLGSRQRPSSRSSRPRGSLGAPFFAISRRKRRCYSPSSRRGRNEQLSACGRVRMMNRRWKASSPCFAACAMNRSTPNMSNRYGESSLTRKYYATDSNGSSSTTSPKNLPTSFRSAADQSPRWVCTPSFFLLWLVLRSRPWRTCDTPVRRCERFLTKRSRRAARVGIR